MFTRAIVIWLVMAVVGVANGIFRAAVLVPSLGDQRAHLLSTLVLCVLIVLLALLFTGWIGPRTVFQASLVGLLWALLTVLFEFVAGHYIFGNTWRKLLADYNLWQGRIWALVPIVLYLAPRWAFRLRIMQASRPAD